MVDSDRLEIGSINSGVERRPYRLEPFTNFGWISGDAEKENGRKTCYITIPLKNIASFILKSLCLVLHWNHCVICRNNKKKTKTKWSWLLVTAWNTSLKAATSLKRTTLKYLNKYVCLCSNTTERTGQQWLRYKSQQVIGKYTVMFKNSNTLKLPTFTSNKFNIS